MTAISFNILRTLGIWDWGSLCILNVRQQDFQDFFGNTHHVADQVGI